MDKEKPAGTTGPNDFVPESSATAAPPRSRQAVSPLPESIGPYRILSLLGEGGMGTVFKAEQQNPHRLVALKVIKAGFVTVELVRRFEQEAQALGRLQHVGIAQVYEAGTADSGFGLQPYFAMEFIEGRPLLHYAAEQQLDVRARLELMAKVCDAVNHAHQRGIIHRDLKPGNILVDAGGQPKVLDFGVARVTDSDTEATRQTDIGQLIGTLAYMSPEQALANPEELDLRSDVYTLGVILYQLLADKLPYQTVQAAIHEVVRVIREEDPAPLSSINRSYRGDIETIVAKALEKDKARRYGTAAELASDIRRHLLDEPIAARPASASYQMQKFARRHKALVAGGAAVFLALLVGVIASTIEATRARSAEHTALAAQDAATRERDRAVKAEQQATAAEHGAEQDRNRAQDSEAKALRDRNLAEEQTKRANTEAATSKAVRDFLQNDLINQASAYSQSEKGFKVDPNLTVRTALDRAATEVKGKFDKQPAVEGEIENTIASTYQNLGLPALSQTHFARAVELDRTALGETDPQTLDADNNLETSMIMQGKFTEAERNTVQTLEIVRRRFGDNDLRTFRFARRLAEIYKWEGKYAQGEKLSSQTLEVERRVLGPEHATTLSMMDLLAEIYRADRKYAQAEELYSRLVEIRRRLKGPEGTDTLDSQSNLGLAYLMNGKYAPAEELLSQVFETMRRLFGPDDGKTIESMNYLASAYRREQKFPQAEALGSQLLEIQKRVMGPEDPSTLSAMGGLARIYRAEKKYPQAEELLGRALEIARRSLGPDSGSTLQWITDLAYVDALDGNYEESDKLFRDALRDSGAQRQGPLWYDFACTAAVAGRKDDALEHLGQAIDHGFTDLTSISQDDDLKSLHGDPRFDALVARARRAGGGK